MHRVKVCEHGKIVTQCRCPGVKDVVVVRPCPFNCGEPFDIKPTVE